MSRNKYLVVLETNCPMPDIDGKAQPYEARYSYEAFSSRGTAEKRYEHIRDSLLREQIYEYTDLNDKTIGKVTEVSLCVCLKSTEYRCVHSVNWLEEEEA